jgi:hypothetical protein
MSRLSVIGLLFAFCVVSVGCPGGSSAPTVPGTPEGTVEVVAKSLADKQPGVLWNAMPASYQKDVNDLIQLFAEKMDEEVYDKSFAVLNKAIQVLNEKKDFILGHPWLKDSPVEIDGLKKNWSSVVGMWQTVTGSEIKTLRSLKSLDIGKFLSGTGAKLMSQISEAAKAAKEDKVGEALDKLGKLEVEVVESGESTAKIRMTMPDEKPQEEELVKVEGKWIPKEMADDWKDQIQEARKGIEEMDIAASKTQIMAMLRSTETALDNLLSAQNQEEFNGLAMQAIGQVTGGLMGGGMGGMVPGGGMSPPPDGDE